ncbi:MAG TPA: chromate efflux transporter, partial [Herpetosiphonaceae bacterium]|nr:chromate efflux transporter [Herpetosiphonaceae bacterium]
MAARPSQPDELGAVARLFLKLGIIAFGGPAAHIAMMREEVVARRGWMDDQRFLDLLGATNLIPGPNSTEMAIHIGRERAGWRGLIAAGTCFILPAMLIVLGLAAVYTRYSARPEAGAIMYGIKPVIIAIVVQALIALRRTAVKDALTAVVGLAVLGLFLLGANEIALLVAAGLLVMLVRNLRRLRSNGGASTAALLLSGLPASIGTTAAPVAPVSLLGLFLLFLKIGSILYGSGYVLLAFLRADLVERLGWLTDQQLIDAIAIGQFTPGPVFTTATFVGFVVAGWPGAILATLGIFLPSFIFVALSNPLIPRLRRSPWFGALLDGVNVASLGLMAGVTLHLGQVSLVDVPTVAIALAAA